MQIFDQSGNLVDSYDPEAGRLEEKSETVEFPGIPAVPELTKSVLEWEGGNGARLYRRVVTQRGRPEVPARTEERRYKLYIPYTAEELAAREAEREERAEAERAAAEESALREELFAAVPDALMELAAVQADVESTLEALLDAVAEIGAIVEGE